MCSWFHLFLAIILLATGCNIKSQSAVSPPATSFIAMPLQGNVPLTVSFSDSSRGIITHYQWDFGDGYSSTDKEPVHIYNEPGIYTVSLIVTGPDGSGTITKTDYIQVTNEIIHWQRAAQFIGQVKTVEGIVVDSYFASELKGKPTFLNFHKEYQSHFKCIIWYSDRISFLKAFPPNPETHLLNKSVRATGMIGEYPVDSRVPEIILKFPSQIQVVGE